MDPEAAQTPGDVEDSGSQRRAPARSNPVKRTLEDFLLAFEERLREHPDEAATSATAALEGRADGSWRTPIEGGERSGRRLPRRVVGRRPEDQSRPPSDAIERQGPAAPPEPLPVEADALDLDSGPSAPTPTTLEVMAGAELQSDVADPEPGVPTGPPEPGEVAGEPGTAEPAAAAKRRNRHRRRHRHR